MEFHKNFVLHISHSQYAMRVKLPTPFSAEDILFFASLVRGPFAAFVYDAEHEEQQNLALCVSVPHAIHLFILRLRAALLQPIEQYFLGLLLFVLDGLNNS
jgi:hypothetical protein